MLPQRMVALGVKNLAPRYIFMWRPLCLSALSFHFRAISTDPRKKNLTDEAKLLAKQVAQHEELVSVGAPALVISYADVLWRGGYVERRIKDFVPCLDEASTKYLPRLGVDVFKENRFKAKGSVFDYGRRASPWKCCRYKVRTRSCHVSYPSRYDSLLRDIDRMSDYFQRLS